MAGKPPATHRALVLYAAWRYRPLDPIPEQLLRLCALSRREPVALPVRNRAPACFRYRGEVKRPACSPADERAAASVPHGPAPSADAASQSNPRRLVERIRQLATGTCRAGGDITRATAQGSLAGSRCGAEHPHACGRRSAGVAPRRTNAEGYARCSCGCSLRRPCGTVSAAPSKAGAQCRRQSTCKQAGAPWNGQGGSSSWATGQPVPSSCSDSPR